MRKRSAKLVVTPVAIAAVIAPRFNRLDSISEDGLDALFREVVLTRDRFTCQRCGSRVSDNLEAAHLIGRKATPTRWMSANGVCCCWSCHRTWAETRKAEFEAWNRARLGNDRYDLLVRLAATTQLRDMAFLERSRDELRQELEALEKRDGRRSW
jgi:hypothetical protein